MRGDKVWWCKPIWKLDNTLKTRIFFWLALENQILTQDNGQKRSWHGPQWCVFCKVDNESIDHLFVHYSFTKILWKEVLQFFNEKKKVG